MEQQGIPSYMQLTNCGYCAKSMRRKNLKDHTGRCHKGLPVLCAEGEALQRLLHELKLQRDKDKEKKELEHLAIVNQKRLEKQRLKALEKEQEIIQQREAEAQRKEQEEARKKNKRELVRLEKQQSKLTTARQDSTKFSSSASCPTKDDNSDASSSQEHSSKDKGLSSVEAVTVAVGRGAQEALPEAIYTGTATKNVTKVQEEEDRISKLSSLRSFQDMDSTTRKFASCSDGNTDVIHSQTDNKASDSSTARTLREDSYSVEEQSTRGKVSMPTSEAEMRSRFKDARSLEEIVNFCPNFVYDDTVGSVKCMQCSSSACSKPISYQLEPDDSKSLQLAKFRDTKKKMLDHLYKTSMHQKNAKWPAIQPEIEKNVESGTRVIRAIYGKIKAGSGYKCIEEAISEKAADDLDVGNINHGRHFASSMTAPIYEAVKRRVEKSIKKVMSGFGRPPPFCLLADKMTPARTTLQIVGIISPSQETGKLQSICLGVKECHDGTGLGTTEEMVDCLKQYFSSEEIRESLVGVAVDGAYHHHNIKDHLPSVLQFSSEQKKILATCWDAAHLIELSAQKSRGQNSKEKSISIPWIRDTFDTVTSVKTFAGRGKHWKELQDSKSLEASELLNQGVPPENMNNKPLKKFQSFSNTRFARFSQRVLGNMRENFRATCKYIESKSKEGSGLLGKLTRPEFVLRLCGLDDIYDEIGRASERLQSCRVYGWNTVEILENTTHALGDMAECLRNGQPHPKMSQFNSAVEEILEKYSYQGVSLQGSSSENHAESALSKVREDLAQHVDNFTQDLDRRAKEQTPEICQLSREAFAMERILSRTADFVPSEFDQIAQLHSAAGVFKDKLTKEEWQREYLCFTNVVRTENSRLEGNMRTEEAIYSKFFTDPNLTENFTNVSYLLCRSALQSSCEAVTEGMGSVVKNTLEGRENMATEKLSQEVFIRLNGPKSNRNCNGILREAGDLRFGGRSKWHFITNPKAKYNKSSKVLSRLNDEDEKFNFESDTEQE